MGLRVLVLGEGKSEEGEGCFDPASPGTPISEEFLGAAHVIVRRVFLELLGQAAPTLVFPPRLRAARRTGNAGLIADLDGRQRVASNPRHKGILELCVGANSVDLAVLLKDCKLDKRECEAEEVRSELQSAVAGRRPPGGLAVVTAVAKPSLEGWLLVLPESERVSERRAKQMFEADYPLGDAPIMAGVAHTVDLRRLEEVCPTSFGCLVMDLRKVVEGKP
jgi:hypothetical protein